MVAMLDFIIIAFRCGQNEYIVNTFKGQTDRLTVRSLSGLNGAIVIRITQTTMITKKDQIMITKEY